MEKGVATLNERGLLFCHAVISLETVFDIQGIAGALADKFKLKFTAAKTFLLSHTSKYKSAWKQKQLQ